MPLARDELERRLAARPWTSHNIRLTPDVTTRPGQPDFLETDLRLAAILRALSLVYGGRLAGRRVIDLGCLEGGFALALAHRGMDVLGVDARRANLDKARLLKEHFEVPNLEFRLDDVKHVTRERYGTFDVVLALGILYHLDRPVAWLRQLAEVTRRVLVIESHYAPPDETALRALDPRFGPLGPLETAEDAGAPYEGRWYHEFDPEHDREAQLWASYSNRRSFWLTKASLLRAILHAGFDLVWEQHDYTAADYRLHTLTYSRGLFCAVKSGNA